MQFKPPAADPAALSPEEERLYAQLLQADWSEEMTQAVTLALHEIVPALESGIGAGPSGLRYEHLRAAHASSTGRAAVVSLLLRVGKLRANSGQTQVWDCGGPPDGAAQGR